jgi:hypothetical protein
MFPNLHPASSSLFEAPKKAFHKLFSSPTEDHTNVEEKHRLSSNPRLQDEITVQPGYSGLRGSFQNSIPDNAIIIFQGNREFFHHRFSLEIAIIHHKYCTCLELVGYDTNSEFEAPRLYIDWKLLVQKLSNEKVEDYAETVKEEYIHAHKPYCWDDLIYLGQVHYALDYIFRRLTISLPSSRDNVQCNSAEFHLKLVKVGDSDFIFPTTGHLDILLSEKPWDLMVYPLHLPFYHKTHSQIPSPNDTPEMSKTVHLFGETQVAQHQHHPHDLHTPPLTSSKTTASLPEIHSMQESTNDHSTEQLLTSSSLPILTPYHAIPHHSVNKHVTFELPTSIKKNRKLNDHQPSSDVVTPPPLPHPHLTEEHAPKLQFQPVQESKSNELEKTNNLLAEQEKRKLDVERVDSPHTSDESTPPVKVSPIIHHANQPFCSAESFLDDPMADENFFEEEDEKDKKKLKSEEMIDHRKDLSTIHLSCLRMMNNNNNESSDHIHHSFPSLTPLQNELSQGIEESHSPNRSDCQDDREDSEMDDSLSPLNDDSSKVPFIKPILVKQNSCRKLISRSKSNHKIHLKIIRQSSSSNLEQNGTKKIKKAP